MFSARRFGPAVRGASVAQFIAMTADATAFDNEPYKV